MRLFKRSRSAKGESHQQQQEPTRSKSAPLHEKEKEYVYVPSRFGYDYAPPSLLAPSHSVDDSSTVQQHLSNMLYAEEPVSAMSGNTASISSYYKKKRVRDPVKEAMRQHQEFEAKYQKAPSSVPSSESRHLDWKIQKPGGSKSHWRPSEKEQRQRLSEQQKQRRAEKFREFSTLHESPPPQPPPQSYREQRDPAVPDPYHHRSIADEARDPAAQIPTLRNMPSLDSGLQYTREQSRQSRYSLADSVASSRRSNLHRTRSQQPPQTRYSKGNSVVSSHRSNNQRTRQQQQQPMHPIQPMLPNQPVRQIQQPIPHRLASHHSVDASTITTQPDAFGRGGFPPQQQGTYYRKYEGKRNAHAAAGGGRPPMQQSHDQHILSHRPSSHHRNEGGASAGGTGSARERKRNIEKSYKDYLMRERGWVPTALVAADIVQASKKNIIAAKQQNKIDAKEAARRKEEAPRTKMYTGPTSTAPTKATVPKVETKKEEKRVPIAPVVPPKKKGFLKRLFGRGKSKNKKSKSKKSTSKNSSTGSRKRPPRIQVDPPSKGTIRGVNPARSIGNSASTRGLSYSTDGGSKNKQPKQIHIPPPTRVPKFSDETPMEMTVARSKASSHKVYGQKTHRGSKDPGGLRYASNPQTKTYVSNPQMKTSSDQHIISQVQKQLHQQKRQQQQSTGGSSQQSSQRAPNSIFFPDSTRHSTAGSSHSRHPADASSTKYYSTGESRSTLQSRQSSHSAKNNSAFRVNESRSSSFDRRQPQPNSSRSSSTYDQYWRQAHTSLVSTQLSRSTSHQGLKKNRSGDGDWKPDPRMPDPWVKPRASNVIVRGTHRGNTPHSAQGALVANNSIFNFGCV